MTEDIEKINSDFYYEYNSSFHAIPFESILPSLIRKYDVGGQLLEIGSEPGVLAV